jgi:hypothetical protein
VKMRPRWRLCRTLKQDLQQFIGIRFEGLTNLDEFQDVNTPFAAFIFGDKRLRPAKSLGEFVLGKTCAFSCFNQKITEGNLAFRMDRLVEFARTLSHRRGRMIRSSD